VWRAISRNRYDGEWEGVRKKDKNGGLATANQVKDGGKAETKVTANREVIKNI
jgi:hypothetical protein